ncbi:MAG: GAF domain-containing protein [Sedimentisphaerales bacterium]|nr:GAF domain-containing protein [Sedimentisphaerales bacterium]
MLGAEKKNITILSLLNTRLDQQLRDQLRGRSRFAYRRGHGLFNSARLEQLQDSNFWTMAPVDRFDVILVQVMPEDLARLTAKESVGPEAGLARRWSSVPAAVVAVLEDGQLDSAVQAAMLDFDGILASSYDIGSLEQTVTRAMQRHRDRNYLAHRYGKLRRVCREVNKRRRHLRQKVDLLCGDMVDSNMNLAETVRRLRDAYGFQSSLLGEYDMGCMLHKALREISEKSEGANTAFYSCASGAFEAHIVADGGDCAEIGWTERAFTHSVVEEVRRVRGNVCVNNAGVWETDDADSVLAGLKVLACPVCDDGVLVGVLVLYRLEEAFSKVEINRVESFLAPLGRVLTALEKLVTIVG